MYEEDFELYVKYSMCMDPSMIDWGSIDIFDIISTGIDAATMINMCKSIVPRFVRFSLRIPDCRWRVSEYRLE